MILVAVALVGMGSSVFHPESSRVARMASGGQHGLAQSLFQVGGNAGSALGPLLAAFIVLPYGQRSIAWFSIIGADRDVSADAHRALVQRAARGFRRNRRAGSHAAVGASPKKIAMAHGGADRAGVFEIFLSGQSDQLLHVLPDRKFHLPVRSAQLHLFVFLGAVAAGTIIGGPVGDRIGRKHVIWWSILGPLPFTLMLPYANLFWTGMLTVIIGLLLASAFPAIIVYAQELVPGRIGAISGLVLRPRVRDGRNRRGVAGETGGRDQHRIRVSRVRVSAGDRVVGRVSAEPGKFQGGCADRSGGSLVERQLIAGEKRKAKRIGIARRDLDRGQTAGVKP